MKKRFLFGIFFFALHCAFGEDFKSRTVFIPYASSELLAKIYVFNDFDEGEKIAETVYGIKNLKKIANSGKFEYLRPLAIGHEIEGYNYGIFKYGQEFWIFKNVDDSKLYGMGKYIKTTSKR